MKNKLLYNLSAGLSGLIFGIGLLLSGMSNPHKVIGFLDLSGQWDPSLAFVMGGAIFIGLIGFTLVKKYPKSIFNESIEFKKSKFSSRILIGSLIFGVGWGITGVCPGPGIVNLGSGSISALIFIVGLLIGTALYFILINRKIVHDNSK